MTNRPVMTLLQYSRQEMMWVALKQSSQILGIYFGAKAFLMDYMWGVRDREESRTTLRFWALVSEVLEFPKQLNTL